MDEASRKAMRIITLEDVLAELEGRPECCEPVLYCMVVFGTPGDAGGWGWRFEGHHLSLNCTVVGGKAVIFSARPPGEILTAENRKAIVLETVGVAAPR
jgi:hypothetical protein